jgi:putative transposase
MKRSDTGNRKLPAELVDLIEGMALRKPRPSVATIHRRMTALAAKRKWTPPSYGSVYGIVRHLNPAMVTLAQDGPAAFRDRYEFIYRHRAQCPNATWQADHTLLDILVLEANGEAVRPWLTIVIDDYSRAVAGYTIFLGAPTALQTALALRQAIWNKQCVFRANPATDSTRILPLIPRQSCHRFHMKAATDSIRKLPAIPRQSCH